MTMKCGAARDLRIDEERDWDAAEAKASVFKWAGFDSGKPSPSMARQAFLAYDASNPDLKGSYHLPFATVSGSGLVAVAAGIRNAASRLPQTANLGPAASSARSVIENYESRFKNTGGKKKATPIFMPEEVIEQLYDRVNYSRMLNTLRYVSTPDLMDQIHDNPLFDPNMFKDVEPYGWRAAISNTNVDSYHTRMTPSTLHNYAEDATEGVPFQHSHDHESLPIGRSLHGRFIRASNGKPARVEADFYSFPGIKSKDITSDEFMRGVQAGIYRDVSVGFYGGRYLCDLCGSDLMSYECGHFPGMRYSMDDSTYNLLPSVNSEDDGKVTATAGVDGARLAEVSTVFHGSTPGAGIVKARSLARAGELTPELVAMLEMKYGAAIPVAARFAGIEVPHLDIGGRMDEDTETTPKRRKRATDADNDRESTGEMIKELPNQNGPKGDGDDDEDDQYIKQQETHRAKKAKKPYDGEDDEDADDYAMDRKRAKRAKREMMEGEGSYAMGEGEMDARAVDDDNEDDDDEDMPPPPKKKRAAAVAKSAADGSQQKAPNGKNDFEEDGDEEEDAIASGKAPTNANQGRPGEKRFNTSPPRKPRTEIEDGDEEEDAIATGKAPANADQGRPAGGRSLKVRSLSLSEDMLDELDEYGVDDSMGTRQAMVILVKHIRKLDRYANDGRAYRKKCIDEAIDELVRARGADTDTERYRKIMARESIETIRQMADDWREMAGGVFKPGRKTLDGDDSTPKSEKRSVAPDPLYMA